MRNPFQRPVRCPDLSASSLVQLWYFESFATSALLYPLLNLCLRRKGLTEAQIGVVAALRPWASAATGNLWAGLGDSTGAHKTVLMVAYLATVSLRFCIGLVPSFVTIALFVAMTEAMSAPILILADASSMAAGKAEGDYGKARMWGAVGWGLFSPLAGILVSKYGPQALFNASLAAGILGILPTTMLPTYALKNRGKPLANGSATSSIAEERPGDEAATTHHQNGRAGGFSEAETKAVDGLPSEDETAEALREGLGRRQNRGTDVNSLSQPAQAVAEQGCDGAASNRHDVEAPLFWELSSLLPITPAPETIDYDSHLVDVERLSRVAGPPETAVSEAPPPSGAEALSIWRKVQQIFAEPEVVIFFVMTVLYGFAAGCIDGYVFLYLDQLGAPEALMGLTITVACIIELPVFHFMGNILSFVGVEQMLHWVLFFFLVRLGYYTMLGRLPTPWLILPVETLNGITFGCAWAAGTVYCSRIAPAGLQATTQAIFQSLYMGLGLGLGGLFGGVVYNTRGPVATFAGAFATVAVGWLLCAAAQQLVRWLARRKRRRRPGDDDNRLSAPLLAGA